MALAGRIVAAVAAMRLAVVDQLDPGRRQAPVEPPQHFGCDRTGGRSVHGAYIGRFRWQIDVNPKCTGGSKERGRCAVPGCGEPGEYKAPLQPANFNGPGSWRFLCLDHVREHNAKYNFFDGMSPEEITRGADRRWPAGSGRAANSPPTAPTRRPAGAISPIRSTRSRRASAVSASGAVALQQGRAARAVGARPRRGRRPPCAAPALFAAGAPLSPRQERRRPQPRGAARRGDRGLSAAAEVGRPSLSRGRARRAGNRRGRAGLRRPLGRRSDGRAAGRDRRRAAAARAPISSTQSA